MVLRIALRGWERIWGCRPWKQHVLIIWPRLSSRRSSIPGLRYPTCSLSDLRSHFYHSFWKQVAPPLDRVPPLQVLFWHSLVLLSTIWSRQCIQPEYCWTTRTDMEVILCTKFWWYRTGEPCVYRYVWGLGYGEIETNWHSATMCQYILQRLEMTI